MNSKQIGVVINKDRFNLYAKKSRKTYERAFGDVVNDLVRTSSQNAPHDKGILEKSWTKEKKFDLDGGASAVVSYSVKKASDGGNFNYALKMHEDESYNLGKGSQKKKGGQGMSGKQYKVGAGYLGDVAKGEAEAYRKHIRKELKRFSNKF